MLKRPWALTYLSIVVLFVHGSLWAQDDQTAFTRDRSALILLTEKVTETIFANNGLTALTDLGDFTTHQPFQQWAQLYADDLQRPTLLQSWQSGLYQASHQQGLAKSFTISGHGWMQGKPVHFVAQNEERLITLLVQVSAWRHRMSDAQPPKFELVGKRQPNTFEIHGFRVALPGYHKGLYAVPLDLLEREYTNPRNGDQLYAEVFNVMERHRPFHLLTIPVPASDGGQLTTQRLPGLVALAQHDPDALSRLLNSLVRLNGLPRPHTPFVFSFSFIDEWRKVQWAGPNDHTHSQIGDQATKMIIEEATRRQLLSTLLQQIGWYTSFIEAGDGGVPRAKTRVSLLLQAPAGGYLRKLVQFPGGAAVAQPINGSEDFTPTMTELVLSAYQVIGIRVYFDPHDLPQGR